MSPSLLQPRRLASFFPLHFPYRFLMRDAIADSYLCAFSPLPARTRWRLGGLARFERRDALALRRRQPLAERIPAALY